MPRERRIDIDQLRQLVEVDGLSYHAAARELGVRHESARKAAIRSGILSPFEPRPYLELHDEAWLRQQFAAGRSVADVADELGVHATTVARARSRLGISTLRTRVDVDEVRRRLDDGQSIYEIAKALGRAYSTIWRVVDRHGLR